MLVNIGFTWFTLVFTGTNGEFGHEKSGFKQHNWVV
jgi:hypothetical protein